MSKYNEVMKNIVITDEMRSRILENIDKEFSGDDSGKDDVNKDTAKVAEVKSDADKSTEITNDSDKILKFIYLYGSKVAIFALIVVGTYGVIKTVGLNKSASDSTSSSYEYAAESTESAMAPEDLSDYDGMAEESYESTMDDEEATETEEAAETEAAEESAEAEEHAVTEETSEMAGNASKKSEEMAATEGLDMAATDDQNIAETEKQDMAAVAGNNNSLISDSEKVGTQKTTKPQKTGKYIKTKDEFVKSLGFSFKELTSLSKMTDEADYYIYDNGGEIRYFFEDGSAYFYIADNAEFVNNMALLPDTYESDEDIEIAGTKAAVYTDYDNRKTVVWNADNCFYGLTVTYDISTKELQVLFTD
ncbi:hypothetical protein [Butyrivibrio sp. AE3004]|uniref:hypothetical protein n=1 Tax=Butyrivibrio sp. AE3004 TaxID=1506994 RepID=UPI000A914DBF|nr:hypothetical protein [Butyrivibrio sp. AE3004]